MHPATRQVLRFFRFDHLTDGVSISIASTYADMAHVMANRLPEDPETTVALRKLLESKDAAVRAALQIPEYPVGNEVGGHAMVYTGVTVEDDPDGV